jgi:hypothetical protein
MPDLRSMIETDAAMFVTTSDFGESITYVPHRYFGEEARSSRTINAVVEREQIAVLTDDVETVAPMFVVHVANNVTTGIASDEIDLGRDRLSFPKRDGTTAETFTILHLRSQDNGMLVLECR